MYKIHDGDYDIEKVGILEMVLNVNIEELYTEPTEEHCIENPETFHIDGGFNVLFNYRGSDWADDVFVPLSPTDIEIVRECIPNPGIRPFFHWED